MCVCLSERLFVKMLSSVTDRDCDVNTENLDALRLENVAKNRNVDIVPCM